MEDYMPLQLMVAVPSNANDGETFCTALSVMDDFVFEDTETVSITIQPSNSFVVVPPFIAIVTILGKTFLDNNNIIMRYFVSWLHR